LLQKPERLLCLTRFAFGFSLFYLSLPLFNLSLLQHGATDGPTPLFPSALRGRGCRSATTATNCTGGARAGKQRLERRAVRA
jgi:hypothetical protein